MSELKTYKMVDEKYCADCVCVIPSEVYLKSEADKVIADLIKKNKRLANKDMIMASETIKDLVESHKMEVEQLLMEIAELKAKIEDVQATAYAESVDAGMENRRLKRALWLARAEWARSSALSYHIIESHPDKDVSATYKRKANKWEKAKDKCLKKAEEYK